MTSLALDPPTGPAAPRPPLRQPTDTRQSRRAWRAARVTVLSEFYEWGRVASTLAMLLIRAALTYWLWQALYTTTKSSAGLNARQATTYALLGVFYVAFRMVNRWASRDTMVQHMLEGTIAYWFLRPVSPRRFYCIRASGDLAYGACWGAVAYAISLACGVIAPPVSTAAGLAALAGMALGLVTLYYLRLLIDLCCFWTVVNNQLVIMYEIVQNVLAGALVPLWFFPGRVRLLRPAAAVPGHAQRAALAVHRAHPGQRARQRPRGAGAVDRGAGRDHLAGMAARVRPRHGTGGLR